jgi:hypothetical protein
VIDDVLGIATIRSEPIVAVAHLQLAIVETDRISPSQAAPTLATALVGLHSHPVADTPITRIGTYRGDFAAILVTRNELTISKGIWIVVPEHLGVGTANRTGVNLQQYFL